MSGLFAQTSTNEITLKSVKTYAWADSTKPAKDPFWNDQILGIVDRVLAGKGLKRVDLSANPDAVALYSLTVDNDVFYIGWEARLRVDIRDPSRKTSLWHADSSDILYDKSHKNVGKLEKMIEKMFRSYPRLA